MNRCRKRSRPLHTAYCSFARDITRTALPKERRQALNSSRIAERSLEGVGLIWSVSLCCFFSQAYCLLYIVGAFPSSFRNTRERLHEEKLLP